MVYLVRRSDFLNYLSFSDAFHTKIRTVRKHGLLPGHTWSVRNAGQRLLERIRKAGSRNTFSLRNNTRNGRLTIASHRMTNQILSGNPCGRREEQTGWNGLRGAQSQIPPQPLARAPSKTAKSHAIAQSHTHTTQSQYTPLGC